MSKENNLVKHLFSLFVRFAFMSFMFTGVEAFLLELKSFPSDFLRSPFLFSFSQHTTTKTENSRRCYFCSQENKDNCLFAKSFYLETRPIWSFSWENCKLKVLLDSELKGRWWKVFNLYSIFTMFKLFNFIIYPSTMALSWNFYSILFDVFFVVGWWFCHVICRYFKMVGCQLSIKKISIFWIFFKKIETWQT